MPQHMGGMGGHPFEQYRRDLENLNWSRGLTKDDIMAQCPNCPPSLFQNVPSDQRFYSFQEFWSYTQVPTGRMGTEGLGRMGM